jgi:hypothetical protein
MITGDVAIQAKPDPDWKVRLMTNGAAEFQVGFRIEHSTRIKYTAALGAECVNCLWNAPDRAILLSMNIGCALLSSFCNLLYADPPE